MQDAENVEGRLQPAAALSRDEKGRRLLGNVYTPVEGALVLELWLNPKAGEWSVELDAPCGCQMVLPLRNLIGPLLRGAKRHTGGKHGA